MSQPSTVLVINRADMEALRFEPEVVDLLKRPDVLVVEYPVLEPPQLTTRLGELGLLRPGGGASPYDPESYAKVAHRLGELGLLRPGVRAVESPYDPWNYAEISRARENFALEKHFVLTTVCAYLGATLVKIAQVEIKSQKGTDVIDLSGGHPGVFAAQAKYNKEHAAHLEGQITLEDRFDGGPPDVEKAKAILREKRLSADPNLWSLVTARASDNSLWKRVLSLSLTDESSGIIEAAAQLKVPSCVKLDLGRREAASVRVEYRLTYQIEFPHKVDPLKGKDCG